MDHAATVGLTSMAGVFCLDPARSFIINGKRESARKPI